MNYKNGNRGNTGLGLKTPYVPILSYTSRSFGARDEQYYFGQTRKFGQKGISLKFSFLVISIFHLHSHLHLHSHSHKRLDAIFLSNIITPALEYSPDNSNEGNFEIDEGNYLAPRNSSRKIFERLSNQEMGQFMVQKNIENNFTSFILRQHKIQNDMKKVIRVHEVKPWKVSRILDYVSLQKDYTTHQSYTVISGYRYYTTIPDPINMEAESDTLADNDDLSPDSETSARILEESHQTVSRIMINLMDDIRKREISVGRLEVGKKYTPREMTRVLAKEGLRKLLHQLNGITTCYTDEANTLGDPEAPEEVTKVTITRCVTCNQRYVLDSVEDIIGGFKKRLRVDDGEEEI
jgi:hypothetical protein